MTDNTKLNSADIDTNGRYLPATLQIDDRRLTDCSIMLSRLILPSRPLANELCWQRTRWMYHMVS